MSRIRARRTIRQLMVAAGTAAAIAIMAPATSAMAAPPGNDAMSGATAVMSLPFVETVDLTEATTEPAEPSNCGFNGPTVWYRFMPTSNVVMRATATGATATSAYLEFSPGFLVGLGCRTGAEPVPFTAFAGSTYLVQVGAPFGGGGSTEFTLDRYPAPANDDFSQATPLSAVPFTDTVDTTASTTQPGEPLASCGGNLINSSWYAFTPAVSGTYSARSVAPLPTDVGVFTGSAVSALTRVACGGFGGSASWAATAGQTYYLQLGSTFSTFSTSSATIVVDVAPPPTAQFTWGPTNPSVHDTVQFFDTSTDGANLPIETREWDFGDGTTGEGGFTTHRYATDGDYAVTLAITTVDGRHATVTNTVSVRTHDVRIVKLDVPRKTSAGRTETITVSVANSRYPETVQVQLMRGRPSGFETFATSSQLVQVLRNGKTVDYRFSYTFTSDDAALGRVSFRAVASIEGQNDALAADNEALATTTLR
jgi:PKD repeat protein